MKKILIYFVATVLLATTLGAHVSTVSATLLDGSADLVIGGTVGSADGQFDTPIDTAIDSNGNIYVLDKNNSRVQKFNSSGTFVLKFGSQGSGNGQFGYSVEGIVIDSNDNIYVADSTYRKIHKFDGNGNYLAQWTISSSGIMSPRITSISINSANTIYVAIYDSMFSAAKIQKYSSTGTLLSEFGTYGNMSGQMSRPVAMYVDSSNNVFVSDLSRRKIIKFDASGVFQFEFGNGYGTGDSQFQFNQGIAVDGTGNIYVSDSQLNRIQKFDSSGNFVTKWGSQGSGVSQFNYPTKIKFDAAGNLYVSDRFNHRIVRLNAPPQNNQRVYIDATPPEVTNVVNNGFYATVKSPTFNEGTATLAKNGGEVKPFENGDKITEDGTYVLTAIDYFNNVTTVKFTIDQTVPVILGVTDKAIYQKSQAPTFNEGKATLARNHSIPEAFVSGSEIKDDGFYVLKVADEAGNEVVASFVIDQTAPVISEVSNQATYKIPMTPIFNEGSALLVKDGGDSKTFVSGTTLSEDGRYLITVTDEAGNVSSVTFVIDQKVYVDGINVNLNQINLWLNQTARLEATVTPGNATNSKFVWASSNPLVAAVNLRGMVTAKSEGTATITATTLDGGYQASTTVQSVWTEYARAVQVGKARIIEYAPSNRQSMVTENVRLLGSGLNKSIITWKSYNQDVISDKGIVRRPSEGQSDKIVTLVATIKVGKTTYRKTYQLLVMAK